MRKIAKRILPLSLHTSSQDIADLKAMLKDDSLSREDREYVRQTLQKVQKKENEQKVLKVRVVGVTCLASCFPCLNGFSFPIIILDECSQITEPLSCLSIARFHCNKLILVGDPKQLPPTITAVDHASSFKNLEFTLFERLLACGYEKIFLKTQYRCHPEISRLASDLFYDSQVVSGISSAERVPLLEELPCLLFVDVEANQEIRDPTGSYKNLKEAHVISEALKRLVVFGLSTAEIGVISLYKSQSRCIQEIYGESCQQPVMISTVDAFQGGEREVILLSTVRISSDYTFLENERRVNVALTRAKRHLLIFGSLKHLQKNKLWAKIINYCEKKKFVRKSDFLFKTAEAESSADL
ncbi:5'-3' DNA helicase ZGRF1-like [Zophobas morio]|uniref:5'-3' DNA helicase ZGRF1-like n=1 Tax=Zophobas morio TaxID=2755281 RepID=UPI003082D63D